MLYAGDVHQHAPVVLAVGFVQREGDDLRAAAGVGLPFVSRVGGVDVVLPLEGVGYVVIALQLDLQANLVAEEQLVAVPAGEELDGTAGVQRVLNLREQNGLGIGGFRRSRVRINRRVRGGGLLVRGGVFRRGRFVLYVLVGGDRNRDRHPFRLP